MDNATTKYEPGWSCEGSSFIEYDLAQAAQDIVVHPYKPGGGLLDAEIPKEEKTAKGG